MRATRSSAAALFSLLCGAGCLSLSQNEKLRLGELDRVGYSLETSPAGFSAPVDETTAAGLNLLPGIGNAYLANKGAGGTQWAVGAGNLLLWPVSPLWSVAEGYLDARTINRRALLEYWDGHPELAESMGKSEAGHAPDAASAAATAIQLPFPESAPPRPAPYEIETVQPYSEGKAVYRVTIRDETRTAFDIERAVRPEIVRILREAFAADSPGVSESSIRAYAIPDFGPDRTLRFTGRAFSLEPVADGWEYDQAGRGRIRLRLSGGMTPEEAKRWARENIAAIVAEKNVVLKAGQMPPAGATFRSLGETFEDGVLSIDFVTEQ